MASESFPSWICRGPSDPPPLHRMSLYAQRQRTFIWAVPSANVTTGVKSMEKMWEELVQIYSKSEITKPTDRLVAFRGIFNRLSEVFEGQEPDWCVAGLWKTSLVKQLLWKRHGEIDKSDPKMIARGKELFELFPSWSWAACPTNIVFPVIPSLSDNWKPVEDMVHIETIQPGQPLHPEATYTAFETSSRIVLRGLVDAKFNSETVARAWAVNTHAIEPEVLISFGGKRFRKFDAVIIFDRPFSESVGYQDLKLLPIRISIDWGYVYGLLVESQGIWEGVPTYRRLGRFDASPGVKSVIPGRAERMKKIPGLKERSKDFPILQLV